MKKVSALLIVVLVLSLLLVGCGSSPDLSTPESAKAAMTDADKKIADRATAELGGQQGLGASVREVTVSEGEVKVWTDLPDDDASGQVAEQMGRTVLVGTPGAESVWVIAENLSPFDRWTLDQ